MQMDGAGSGVSASEVDSGAEDVLKTTKERATTDGKEPRVEYRGTREEAIKALEKLERQGKGQVVAGPTEGNREKASRGLGTIVGVGESEERPEATSLRYLPGLAR